MCGPIIENEHLWVCTKFMRLHIPISLVLCYYSFFGKTIWLVKFGIWYLEFVKPCGEQFSICCLILADLLCYQNVLLWRIFSAFNCSMFKGSNSKWPVVSSTFKYFNLSWFFNRLSREIIWISSWNSNSSFIFLIWNPEITKKKCY